MYLESAEAEVPQAREETGSRYRPEVLNAFARRHEKTTAAEVSHFYEYSSIEGALGEKSQEDLGKQSLVLRPSKVLQEPCVDGVVPKGGH